MKGLRMLRTYRFDDAVLSPGRFRFHVLCALNVHKYLDELIMKQKRRCPLCKGKLGPLDKRSVVDHIRTVKSFAYDLKIPLTKAYLRCHDIGNLRAVHRKCNSDRNRHREGDRIAAAARSEPRLKGRHFRLTLDQIRKRLSTRQPERPRPAPSVAVRLERKRSRES